MYLRWIKSTRRLKRIVLWALLVFQLFLIAIFVGFGTAQNPDIEDGMTRIDVGVIQFVTEVEGHDISLANSERKAASATPIPTAAANIQAILTATSGDFHREFVNCYKDTTNNETIPFYCYRNGSIEPSQIYMENDIDEQDCACKCQPNYHGKDCGQPEVVWRAFMTAKLSRKDVGKTLAKAVVPKPPRIFYIIEATGLSLSTIEMQFMELNELVDLFVLCDQLGNHSHMDSNSMAFNDRLFSHHQSSYQHAGEFFLKKLKHKILIVRTMQKCTLKLMYKHLMQNIEAASLATGYVRIDGQQQRAEDILLFSRADEIVNRQAIAYLKWYNDWTEAQPIRFRLKHTVYGFYWQHPNHTVLASVACQLHVLDENYNGDPNRLVMDNSVGMIIGDLNHYGGWYCQYCYESPMDIVEKLQADRDMMVINRVSVVAEAMTNGANDNKSDNNHRKPAIVDSNYIQSLISAGLFVDRTTNLLRLHRYSDKYYAPDYVCSKNGKYQSMLTNMYAQYDNDIDDEE